MHDHNWKHLLIGAFAALAASALLLWAWNTLAALFGAPEAGIRHVLALLIAGILLRGLLGSGRRVRR